MRPGTHGRFGRFGGQYVPETLMPALAELEQAAALAWKDPLSRQSSIVCSRITSAEQRLSTRLASHRPLPACGWWSAHLVETEDLNHTGAHKINNALGQALLALRMGKKRIIAETGAGQHGVATATVCARFDWSASSTWVEDMCRQALNVFRMRLLGAKVQPVTAGTATLKDATSEAIRDWVTNVETTHWVPLPVRIPTPCWCATSTP